MLGFRSWHCRVDGPDIKLGSLFHNYIWDSKIVGNELEELIRVDDRVFDFGGQSLSVFGTEDVIPALGFWAYSDLSNAIQEAWEFTHIIGLVSGYGKLHKHQYGFRSEYMQVLAFLGSKEIYGDNIVIYGDNQFKVQDVVPVVHSLAAFYGVPLMSLEEMESFRV